MREGRSHLATARRRKLVAIATAAATAAFDPRTGIVTAISFDGSSYARNTTLDPNVEMFWTIDTDLETIRVAIHAKDASGWVGWGMSEMGGMDGADIVYYEAATGNIIDSHSLVAGQPVTDECSQDWTLLSAEADASELLFEVERAFDTGDIQDHIIVDDSFDWSLPTRVLAAWGDEELISYHGSNFVKDEVVLFGGMENSNPDPILELTSSPTVYSFDVTAQNFTIPTIKTWYQDSCRNASLMPTLEEYHVIGFEGVLQPDTEKYVHHFVLKAFYDVDDCGIACNAQLQAYYAELDDDSISSSSTEALPCSYDSADIFLWAPGASDFDMPDDVGFKQFRSVSLQTHFDNPDGDEGMVDDSGIRIYYTEEMRPIDMGVMQLADPAVAMYGTSVPPGRSTVAFTCPSSCTEENFEAESVTVFSHMLHMHENGQMMQTRQYRNDSDGVKQLIHTANVEYFSFLQAGGHMTTYGGDVTIEKGDRFETECYYDTSLSSVDFDNVTFGLGSENEMCVDYVFYHPWQPLPRGGVCGLTSCGGSLDHLKQLADDSNFNRTFGLVTDTCPEPSLEEDVSSASAITLPGVEPFLWTTLIFAGVSMVVVNI